MSEQNFMERWANLGWRVAFGIAGGAILYLAIAAWAGWGLVLDAFKGFPADRVMPVVATLVFGGWLLRGLRWHLFVRRFEWPVPFGQSLLAFFGSFAFTATPGKMGEVVKSGLLKRRYAVPLTESVAGLLVERLHDLLSVLILTIGGFGLHRQAAYILWVAVGAIGMVGTVVCWQALHQTFFRAVGRIPHLASSASRLAILLTAARGLLNPGLVAVAQGMSLVSWACEAIAFYVILAGFGVDVPLLTAAFVYGLSTLAGALSMLPGGIGGTDAVMLLLLESQGVAGPAAAGATLLLRASTLWFVTFMGALFLLGWFVIQPQDAPGRKAT